MYIVMIEWDGKKPPTLYYDRLKKKFGLYVRGDKDEKNPLVRRTNWRAMQKAETAVVFQEGAIMCTSESLARRILMYAEDNGAKNIVLMDAERIDFNVTVEDAKIFQQLEAKFGQRGRPSGQKSNFVITCFEEAATYPVYDSFHALICPACKGNRTRSHVGDIVNYKLPDDGDIVEAWLRNRFTRGEFEIPDSGDNDPPATVNVTNVDELRIINQIKASPTLMADIARMPRRQAAAFLDAVFCSRTYVSAEARRDARVKACVTLYEQGVQSTEISLLERPSEFDLLDASAVAEPDKTAALWLVLHGKGGQP